MKYVFDWNLDTLGKKNKREKILILNYNNHSVMCVWSLHNISFSSPQALWRKQTTCRSALASVLLDFAVRLPLTFNAHFCNFYEKDGLNRWRFHLCKPSMIRKKLNYIIVNFTLINFRTFFASQHTFSGFIVGV